MLSARQIFGGLVRVQGGPRLDDSIARSGSVRAAFLTALLLFAGTGWTSSGAWRILGLSITSGIGPLVDYRNATSECVFLNSTTQVKAHRPRFRYLSIDDGAVRGLLQVVHSRSDFFPPPNQRTPYVMAIYRDGTQSLRYSAWDFAVAKGTVTSRFDPNQWFRWFQSPVHPYINALLQTCDPTSTSLFIRGEPVAESDSSVYAIDVWVAYNMEWVVRHSEDGGISQWIELAAWAKDCISDGQCVSYSECSKGIRDSNYRDFPRWGSDELVEIPSCP